MRNFAKSLSVAALAWLLSLALSSFCAGGGVRRISSENGLPSSTVRAIVQDADGFMWFGTDDGLCRFDGYNVRRFANRDLGANQFVSALAVWGDRLLVGGSSGAYVLSTRGEARFARLDTAICSLVNSFCVDTDGNVWVATMGGGLFCHIPHSRATKRYALEQFGGDATSVIVDADNQVWVLSARRGSVPMRLNRATDRFEEVSVGGGDFAGWCLAQMPGGDYLVGTWEDGLWVFSKGGAARRVMSPRVDGVGTHIHSLLPVSDATVLVGCDEGLVAFDVGRGSWRFAYPRLHAAGASSRFVYSLARDREGGVWCGSFYGGVSYLSPYGDRFSPILGGTEGLGGSVVSRFAEDDRHRLWVATDDGGLSCYDVERRRFVDFRGREQMSALNVHGLWAEGDVLWCGTYGDGVRRLDTRTGRVETFWFDADSRRSSCYCLMRDSGGRLWATSMSGVKMLDEARGVFVDVRDFGSLTVDIVEDARGDVWFATQGGGLWRLAADGSWSNYLSDNASAVASAHVNAVRQDAAGRLFVATLQGLYLYVAEADSFRRVEVAVDKQDFNGLAIYQDELWLTSSSGVTHLCPQGHVQVFNRYDGLQGAQFRPNACHLASDGRIWLGLTNGVATFSPHKIRANSVPPPIFLTTMRLFNGEGEALNGRGRVDLSHDDTMLSVDFAALSYAAPEKNRYAYRLDGFDADWVNAGSETTATYTNLPAGEYLLRVRGTNNDGLWCGSEARLQIVVHPPLWLAWPAKVLYVLVGVGVMTLFVWHMLRRNDRRHSEVLRAVTRRKDEEMRDARLRFFTTISHEIRTPVSLIIGSLENLMATWARVGGDVKEGETIAATLDVISRNAHRLLDLVNQLLDFNKVQREGASLHFKVGSILNIMRGVAERFEPTLRLNGVAFDVEYPPADFTAVVDHEGLTKIVSNLMTNATKYARSSIALRFAQGAGDGEFSIIVDDDGPGVAEAEKKKIFSPFYQSNDNKPGTGIGLSIVARLVAAHRGRVEVAEAPSGGARFVVTLPVAMPDVPVGQSADKVPAVVDAAAGREAESGEADADGKDGGKSTLLVVEDDDDLRHFLEVNFANDYKVLTAANGAEAVERLGAEPVGLIVSDWMMPEMDGAELCRRVRGDIATSHVPFIMLTAKTDDDSKAASMDCGADIFIEKPFSMKYLTASIRNLLAMRSRLMRQFAESPAEPIETMAPSPLDNEFLAKLNAIIEQNMDNVDLNVNFLAEQMAMSRSALFLKIKSISSVTPGEMIQTVRLRAAARMLREGRMRVNEVCYRVGYSSPSYFAKCFQKQFGKKPLEYAKAMDN